MIKPACLKEKDTIGIVAPACSVDRYSLCRGANKLKMLGFNVKYSRTIFKRYFHMAGSCRHRAQQVNDMFADKSVKAIFCAKAGHGSFGILPYLDKEIIRKNPKIFVGYSDITILLCYLQKIAGMVVFHGPLLCADIYKSMNRPTLKYLLQAISRSLPMGKLAFSGIRTLRSGKAAGALAGGNLSMLADSIGTPYEIDTDNKILFLEDINENIQKIDNYLTQLKTAGKFNNIKGLIFGKMIGCSGFFSKEFNIKNALNDIFEDRKIPVICNFPSGHIRPRGVNVTLPFGAYAILDADAGSVTIDEAAVGTGQGVKQRF